jgi:hypothetical protein
VAKKKNSKFADFTDRYENSCNGQLQCSEERERSFERFNCRGTKYLPREEPYGFVSIPQGLAPGTVITKRPCDTTEYSEKPGKPSFLQ